MKWTFLALGRLLPFAADNLKVRWLGLGIGPYLKELWVIAVWLGGYIGNTCLQWESDTITEYH